jgi:hypothetical protein
VTKTSERLDYCLKDAVLKEMLENQKSIEGRGEGVGWLQVYY